MESGSFLDFGQNAGFVEEIYRLYLTDPTLVDERWATYFSSVKFRHAASSRAESVVHGVSAEQEKAEHRNGTNGHAAPNVHTGFAGSNGSAVRASNAGTSGGTVGDFSPELQEKAFRLIEAFRERGHLHAKLSPVENSAVPQIESPEFAPDYYGIRGDELAREVRCNGFLGLQSMRLSTLVAELERVYLSSLGFEYLHLVHAEERLWLRERIENRPQRGYGFTPPEQESILRKLIEAELLESELHRKYVGAKRFSAQGGEQIVPMFSVLLEHLALQGVEDVVVGMAHRGRLNVLVNNLGKPVEDLFLEFEDRTVAAVIGAGDVKYHLGHRGKYQSAAGALLGVQLLPNPSHLEAIDPVVEGVVRAMQDARGGRDPRAVLPIVVHGDAACMGQGVVPETLNMSQLRGYRTAGTLNIIINNQVGFTTDPIDGRTGPHASDWAKGIDAPVFHVNADDVEGACWVMKLAADFRAEFGKDVVIDLVCYRKYGHNEGDDPGFTQPTLYAEIKEKKAAYLGYGASLVESGVIDSSFVSAEEERFREWFNGAQEKALGRVLGEASPLYSRVQPRVGVPQVRAETLAEIAQTFVTYPEEFTPYPKLKQILEKRVETLRTGAGIEWGFAEVLAYGSLIQEGFRVRLSGQDVERGTFSHRHSVLHDNRGESSCMPLNALKIVQSSPRGWARYEVFNSPLSEYAVMGFEFGYSHAAPRSLVLWEAQFGDFSNGAQIVIDQFLAAAEAKWNQHSGLVLLLPHGQEGQGPEHSSCRVERYLQLCAENNMSVCIPSQAAQQFHLLRRQAYQTIKRPLIVLTPKSLLRHPGAAAARSELEGGKFEPVLWNDFGAKPEAVVLCSGKIFYELAQELQSARDAKSSRGVRVVRLEQLYPFPEEGLGAALKGLQAKKVIFVQEEPENMGTWAFVERELRRRGIEARYAGKPAAASPAPGSGKRFLAEQSAVLQRVGELLGEK